MLKMIVEASSASNDIVLDCFAGSGTTLGAASELGRKWIGIDNSLESIKAICKRLHGGMDVYGDYVRKPQADSSNPSNGGKTQKPHCSAFTVWSAHEHKQMLQQTLEKVLGAQATLVVQTEPSYSPCPSTTITH